MASLVNAPPAHASPVCGPQRPGAAVSANFGGVLEEAPAPPLTHPPTTPSRPALSLGFKRALARHREALQAGNALRARDHARTYHPHQYQRDPQQQQQQQQHGQGQGQQHGQQQLYASCGGGMVCAEDAVLLGAIDAVGEAAECFTSSLAAYYGSTGSGTGSSSTAAGWPATMQAPATCYANSGSKAAGWPASCGVLASSVGCHGGAAGVVAGASPSAAAKGLGADNSGSAQQHAIDSRRAEVVHNADVSQIALVAAYSWLTQAVTKAARQGSSGGSSKPGMSGAAAAA
eukprot:scaffold228062_cov17-Tisochrysis_lutea.AAC.1